MAQAPNPPVVPTGSCMMSVAQMSVVDQAAIEKKKSSAKLMNAFVVVAVLTGLAALAFSFFTLLDNQRKTIANIEYREAQAREIKHINASAIRAQEEQAETETEKAAKDDEQNIYFSLFTTPSGAEVYKDGLFLGLTPIEQKKFAKSSDTSAFVIVLDGYETQRKTLQLNEAFSEAIQLTKVVIAAPAAAGSGPLAPEPVVLGDGIIANKAVVISDTPAPKSQKTSKSKTKAGGSKAAAPAPADDFVLPD